MQRFIFRFVIGLIFALFGFVNYCGNVSENPVTGEVQRVQLSPRQEVSLGLQSRQQVAAQFGGLHPDPTLQTYLDRVGERVVQQSEAAQSSYPFEFHLLRDPQTVNALALPGGQIFVTYGLLRRLDTEAQLAGVLGHEAGHVVGRHGAEHLAKQQLGSALVNAVGIAASDSPEGAKQAAILAQAVNQLVNLRYGREDELESDRLGLKWMIQAGYNPQGLVQLMQILDQASQSGRPPEFLSSHPNPSNRIGELQAMINQNFPSGIPPQLEEGRDRFAQIAVPRLR